MASPFLGNRRPSQHGPDCSNGQAGRIDVVYPEYARSLLDAGDNAGEGSGVTVFRVRQIEDIPDDGFTRHG